MKLQLTRLGDLARRYGVVTPGSFWQAMLREANRIADQDGDWLMVFDEKILGLTEMRQLAQARGLDYFKSSSDSGSTE